MSGSSTCCRPWVTHEASGVLGALMDLSWRARLQHIDRGWLDLAFTEPLLDCSRARGELGWVPKWTSTDALWPISSMA